MSKTLYELYTESSAYLGNVGLSSGIPIWNDFIEGKQWPEATELTRNLPRPVINFTEMITENKTAGVLSSPVKLHYTSNDTEADTEKFDRFAQYIVKEMELDEVDTRSVDDGAIEGTYIQHIYWNSQARGKKGVVDGAVRAENIEVLDFRVSNPNEPDEQKQKWVMIVSREDVESVREKADKDLIGNAVPDSNDSTLKEIEQQGTDYCTVFTKYYRENGEVFFIQGTKAGDTRKPTSLTPLTAQTGEAKEDIGEDGTPDDPVIEPQSKRKFELYPVIVGCWKRKKKSIYGRGEVQGIISNQKAVNYGMALQLKKIQDEAWGIKVVKEDALQGQPITNEVGQIITDHSKLGNGIQNLATPAMSGMPMNVIQGLLEQTRMAVGATEVMTGEVIGSNMSGSAIAALQSQALKPSGKSRQRWYRFKEKQGLVLAEFFRFYYEGQEFSYPDKDQKGKDTTKKDTFNGSDYLDTDLRVVVEAGAATTYSESGDIAMLEALVNKGLIPLKVFMEAYPKNALSNREEILRAIDEQEKGQVAQLTAQTETMQQQLLKAAEIIKAQSATVEKAVSLVTENQSLKTQIITLASEFTAKISEANQVIMQANSDAAGFAKIIEAAGLVQTPKNPVTQAVK